ncbi:helix-turn-helix transcriptional regulator [archaeon]|jgi:transcription initiation factor IIE alpha subunit|nr:helix-turn-helix transcriptional regulator [archaeon]
MENDLIQSISFIKNSKYRKDVLSALENKELLTPKEISEIVSLRLNHVSMTLGELKNKKLAKCINEDSKRGRLYQIADLGKKTLKWLKEQ